MLLYEISDTLSHSESSLSISDGTVSPEIKNTPMIKSSQLILMYKTTHVHYLSLSFTHTHTHTHLTKRENDAKKIKNTFTQKLTADLTHGLLATIQSVKLYLPVLI